MATDLLGFECSETEEAMTYPRREPAGSAGVRDRGEGSHRRVAGDEPVRGVPR